MFLRQTRASRRFLPRDAGEGQEDQKSIPIAIDTSAELA